MNKNQFQKRIAIVGGGVSGSLASLLFGRDGHSVVVFERISSTQSENSDAHQSHNRHVGKWCSLSLTQNLLT
jgi:2-polyprenyl-6-methoxyphenol hydroxylase-like FAD-dependent oxidoreductase